MQFGLKWIHMARYELILRLDGALWLRIIFKPLLTPKTTIQIKKIPKRCEGRAKRGPELLVYDKKSKFSGPDGTSGQLATRHAS